MPGVPYEDKSPLRCVNSQGHDPRSKPLSTEQDIPYGFCHCGCGQKTNISKYTSTRQGVVKGQPVRFRHGHWARTRVEKSTEDRFWEKVDRRGPDDCWEWTASKNPGGYGYFWDAEIRGMVFAHRWIASKEIAPIKSRKDEMGCGADDLVCHTCDNPSCVNPGHLYVGTPFDNMADKHSRGRDPDYNGHRNPNAKLSADQVEQIRDRYTGAWGEQSALAREFGVTASAIRDIVLGNRWQSR